MEERDYFNEKTETRPHNLQCPSCKQTSEYQIRWIRRTKKPSLPGRASEDDRARFKAARDYMVRVDDVVRAQRVLQVASQLAVGTKKGDLHGTAYNNTTLCRLVISIRFPHRGLLHRRTSSTRTM